MASNPTLATKDWESRGIARRFLDAVLSLKCKATSLVVILTLVVAGVVTWFLLHSTEQLARNEQRRHLLQMVSVLANAAANDYPDCALLQRFAEESVSSDALQYLILMDDNGRIIASAERNGGAYLDLLRRSNAAHRDPVPGQPNLLQFASGDVLLDVTYPVTEYVDVGETASAVAVHARGRLLGYLRTGIAAGEWYRTMSNRLDLAVGVGVLVLVAAIPLGFLLVRRIVAPMDHLVELMRQFSLGKLEVRSATRRRDELGRLAAAFNCMADQHQSTHERIVALNEDLERRVEERTEQLRELASRDPLTGLYNRRYFNETLDRRFAESSRYGNELSCMMFDIDDFKSVNDECGHHVGDDVLVLLGKTIVGELRSSDVAARFGGDEFVVLLPQTDVQRAQVLADRIVTQFATELSNRLPDTQATISVGIATVSALPDRTARTLLRAADRAMYDAKSKGKNRILLAAGVDNASA